MPAGLTDRLWEIEDVIRLMDGNDTGTAHRMVAHAMCPLRNRPKSCRSSMVRYDTRRPRRPLLPGNASAGTNHEQA